MLARIGLVLDQELDWVTIDHGVDQDVDLLNLLLRCPDQANGGKVDRLPGPGRPKPGQEGPAQRSQLRIVVRRQRGDPAEEGILGELRGREVKEVWACHAGLLGSVSML